MITRKKAVSPLIATVLLIAFAVALGAVVMNWGRTQFSDGTVEGPCSEIDFGLELNGESPNICFSDGKVVFLAYNNGNGEISSLKITVISQKGDPYNTAVKEILSSLETKKFSFDIPEEFSSIQKVRITPLILPDPEKTLSVEVCSSQVVEVIQVGGC